MSQPLDARARRLLDRQATAVMLEGSSKGAELTPDRDDNADEATHGIDPFGRFLKIHEVAASVGLCRAMVYKLMHEQPDPFPAPVKIGSASVWVEREVVAWKARRVQSRNARG